MQTRADKRENPTGGTPQLFELCFNTPPPPPHRLTAAAQPSCPASHVKPIWSGWPGCISFGLDPGSIPGYIFRWGKTI